MDPFLIALAGLMGAAGVVLAAAGAHGKPAAGLDSAGYLLLIHAVAVIACTLAALTGLVQRPLGLFAVCAFVLGASLQLLITQSDAKVLASPRIATQSGKEAQVLIGRLQAAWTPLRFAVRSVAVIQRTANTPFEVTREFPLLSP